METKTIKDKIQEEAFQAWVKFGRKGSILARTGFGKNKVAIMAAEVEPNDAKILFLAETNQREKDFRDELVKWNYKGMHIEFMCYQSAYKLKNQHYNLVIADEIDLSLTPIYSSFYVNNTFDHILGLTATLSKRDKVNSDEESITKYQLLSTIAPVCYIYTVDDSQNDGTGRKLNIFKIYHKLDDLDKKAVIVGTKKAPITTSELEGYKYCDKRFQQSLFIQGSFAQIAIRNAAGKRASLLYSLPSKIIECKKLVKGLKGRTILFGNDINSLLNITPNVISSKNTDKKNDLIRTKFESNKINLIGSFKMLKRGANLKDLDNCVIMSYYSTERDMIQSMGRLRDSSKEGNIFIFVTKSTQEEVWFRKMLENITSFNIKEFNNVEDCLTYLKSKEEDDIHDSNIVSISDLLSNKKVSS